MIQTHLLPLQPPYNYIYYGGIVGKQIATMVATVDKTNADGEYGLETHSHPVVVYNGQTAEGVVWDKCEVMDCRVVCSEAEKSVTLKKFNELLMLTDKQEADIPLDPDYMRSALRAAGIALVLPTDHNYYGPDQFGTVKDFKVKLLFDVDDDGFCVWSKYDESPLYFSVNASNRMGILGQLKMQLYNWQRALEEFKLTIEFEAGSPYDVEEFIEYDEEEVKIIIDELNKEAKKE